MTPTHTQTFSVFILDAGKYPVRGQKAYLDIIYSGREPQSASVRPERHPGYVFPVRGIERLNDVMQIQGPNTSWRFKILDQPDEALPKKVQKK